MQAVILEPTRELAIQTQAQIEKFSSIRSVCVYGGASSASEQSKDLFLTCTVFDIRKKKPQVIVATPGRLIDLCQNFNFDISECRYQILDEGDKMLDMGFDKDISALQNEMPEVQTMVFSATVPKYI